MKKPSAPTMELGRWDRRLRVVHLCFLLIPVSVGEEPSLNAGTSEPVRSFELLSAPNKPPEVRMVFPPSGTQFHLVADVHIRAVASDPDGAIKEVRFFDGANLIGIATNAPYEVVSSVAQRNLARASFFTAVALDNEGATTTSAVVGVGFVLHISGNYFEIVDVSGGGFYQVYRPAPASFQIVAQLQFSDGVGNPVDFYLGTNKVGTVVDPPYVLSVTNIPASYYYMRVGTTNVAGVYTLYPALVPGISVIEPTFEQPRRVDPSTFTFNFTKTLSYNTNIIEQSPDLLNWFPIGAIMTTNGSFSFSDPNATNALSRFYRMRMVPFWRLLP
jgi:hypothetical protein